MRVASSIAVRLAAGLAVVAAVASPALAVFDTSNKVWEGITWSDADAAASAAELNGTAPNDTFSLVKTGPFTGAATYTGFYADTLNAGGANTAFFANLNANNRPWFKVTYIDNTAVGASDLSFFIGGSGLASDPRMKLGKYFSTTYLGVMNKDGPSAEGYAYPGAATRVNGTAVTITAGSLGDGTIEFTFQAANLNGGVPVTTVSTFFNDNGVPANWDWQSIALRFRGTGDALNSPVVFTNLEYGNNYGIVPEPASLGLLGLGGLMVMRRRRV